MQTHRSVLLTGLLALLILVFAACTVPTQMAPAASDSTSAAEPAQRGASSAGTTTFQIVSDESEVRFSINEVLLGTAQTVVGATQDIRGEILVNPTSPADSSIGVIEINADALITDNERRNQAIRRFILQTADYPTIAFTPTTLADMPESVSVGDRFSFQVSGDLRIREIVQSVTFDVTIEVLSATELSGSAQTVITRSAFELTIPSVPSVTDVSEEVGLELDFVARAQ